MFPSTWHCPFNPCERDDVGAATTQDELAALVSVRAGGLAVCVRCGVASRLPSDVTPPSANYDNVPQYGP